MLTQANKHLREGNYIEALKLYIQTLKENTQFERIVIPNILFARRKFRESRKGQRPSILICCNELSRANELFLKFRDFANVKTITTEIFPSYVGFPIEQVTQDIIESFCLQNHFDIVYIVNDHNLFKIIGILMHIFWASSIVSVFPLNIPIAKLLLNEEIHSGHLQNEKTSLSTFIELKNFFNLIEPLPSSQLFKKIVEIGADLHSRIKSSKNSEESKCRTIKPFKTSRKLGSISTLPNPEVRILFVLYGSLESNSGYQVQLICRHLYFKNIECSIAIPDQYYSPENPDESFSVHSYSEVLKSNSFSFDILHAWTPREIVRKFCEDYLEKHKIPLVVHLEDNEEYLTSVFLKRSWEELLTMDENELDSIIPEHRYHPKRGRAFLDRAYGFTMVIETLNRYNTKQVPYLVIPPIADERLFYPRPINYELRARLGISPETTVIVYTGNIHEANYEDVYELYKAVELLNEEGIPTVLIRTGLDQEVLTDTWPKKHVIHLGWVKREEVPEIMAAADIFVQPGKDGFFNNERFSCKIPEYFAIGRPVIINKINWNLIPEHLKEAYLVFKNDSESILKAAKEIKSDNDLIRILTEGSINYYLKGFSKDRKETMFEFYQILKSNKAFLSSWLIEKKQIQSHKSTFENSKYKENLQYVEKFEPDKKISVEFIQNKIGLTFYISNHFTGENSDLNLVDFTKSRKKKLYVIANDDLNSSLHDLLNFTMYNLSLNFLDVVFITNGDINNIFDNSTEINSLNCNVFFAKPIINSNDFIKNLFVGKQSIHDKILFFKNLSFLSKEAIEQADAIVLDLRQSILNIENKVECTLITSIFKSDKFIKNFFNNITELDEYDINIAHIIFISSISDYELDLIFEWFKTYSNVAIFWNRNDPGLYECWNIGIKIAQSEFISNANVDDIRNPKQVTTLLKELKERTHISLACTLYVPFYEIFNSYREIPINEVWYTHQVGEFSFRDLAYLERDENGNFYLRPNNIPHCMPVWRKNLHEKYGYFDEKSYGTYADWAFWLKVTLAGEKGYLHSEPLSYYYVNLESHNRRGDKLIEFHKRIEKEYLPHFYWLNYMVLENEQI